LSDLSSVRPAKHLGIWDYGPTRWSDYSLRATVWTHRFGIATPFCFRFLGSGRSTHNILTRTWQDNNNEHETMAISRVGSRASLHAVVDYVRRMLCTIIFTNAARTGRASGESKARDRRETTVHRSLVLDSAY
jgi:hypothetical protein